MPSAGSGSTGSAQARIHTKGVCWLRLLKEVLVELDDVIALLHLDTHPILDNQPHKSDTLNQNDPRRNRLHVIPGAGSESAGGDEDAVQGADEGLNGFPSSCSALGVPFSLHVNAVQPQGVLVYDPVNTAVVAAADALPTLLGSAVSHLEEQVDNRLLEEIRLSLPQTGEECIPDVGVNAIDAGFDLFDRDNTLDESFIDTGNRPLLTPDGPGGRLKASVRWRSR